MVEKHGSSSATPDTIEAVAQALDAKKRSIKRAQVGTLPPLPTKKAKISEVFDHSSIPDEHTIDMEGAIEGADLDPKNLTAKVPNEAKSSSPSINIDSTPSVDPIPQLYQNLSLTPSPNSLMLSDSTQSSSADFENFVCSLVKSPSVASSRPLQPPVFTSDHLQALSRELLVVVKQMFHLQHSSYAVNNQIPCLTEQVSNLSERIKSLEDQVKKGKCKKDEVIAKLGDEEKARLSVEERNKFLEKELETATSANTQASAKIIELEGEIQQAAAKVISLDTKVDELRDNLERKKAALVYSNNIIKDAKEKVSHFIKDSLPQIKNKCYEEAFYIAYHDNIDKYPDLDFPTLPDLNEKIKRKFDLMMERAPGFLEDEFPEQVPIDPVKLLSFDDPLQEEAESDEDTDSDDSDDAEDESEDDADDDDGGARGQDASRKNDDDEPGSGPSDPAPTPGDTHHGSQQSLHVPHQDPSPKSTPASKPKEIFGAQASAPSTQVVASPSTKINRRQVWEKTHTKKDGSISDATSSYFDEIANAKEKINDSDEDKLTVDEDILSQVMLPKSHVKACAIACKQLVHAHGDNNELKLRMRNLEGKVGNLEGKMDILISMVGNNQQGNQAPNNASDGGCGAVPGFVASEFVAPQFLDSTNVANNQKCEILNFDLETIATGTVCRDSTSSNIHGKSVPSTHEKLVLDNILLPDERITKINHQFAETFGDVGVVAD